MFQGPIFVSGEEDNKLRTFAAEQGLFCSSPFLASIQIQGKNHSWRARRGKVEPNGDRVTALSFWYQSGGLEKLFGCM